MITFFVKGKPVPCARPRLSYGRVFIPAETRKWQTRIAWESKLHRPKKLFTGPLFMSVIFYFKKPKSIKDDICFAIGRSDVDNFAKSVMDALHNQFYKNDNQVCILISGKTYGPPGVEITVGEIDTTLTLKGFIKENIKDLLY